MTTKSYTLQELKTAFFRAGYPDDLFNTIEHNLTKFNSPGDSFAMKWTDSSNPLTPYGQAREIQSEIERVVGNLRKETFIDNIFSKLEDLRRDVETLQKCKASKSIHNID